MPQAQKKKKRKKLIGSAAMTFVLFPAGFPRASQPRSAGFSTDGAHTSTSIRNRVVAYESDHILQEEREKKKGSAGRTVPLQRAEKISLSDNSGGQFQTTQNDKGINFPA